MVTGGGIETVMTVVATYGAEEVCAVVYCGFGVSVGGGVRWYGCVPAVMVLLRFVVLVWRIVVVAVHMVIAVVVSVVAMAASGFIRVTSLCV